MHPFKITHYFVFLENCCPVYGVFLLGPTTDVTQLLSEIFFILFLLTPTHSIPYIFFLLSQLLLCSTLGVLIFLAVGYKREYT